jgi:beta-lactamase class A
MARSALPRARTLLVVTALLTGCATTSRPGGAGDRLDARIAAIERRCSCRMGIAARHLESGRVYERNAEQDFESASVVKVAVITEAMVRVREGRVDLSERWELTAGAKADGSGVLLLLDPGLNPTWSDLVTLMIGPSDNTATNAWIDRLGIDPINARMESLGFRHIRLLARLPALSSARTEPSPWKDFRLGTLWPREVAEWMARVATGGLVDEEISRRIFEYLDKDPSRLRIARRFSSDFLWAGKSGTMRGVRNDSGVLRTKKGRFVFAILTDRSRAQSASAADHPSVLAIADAARSIYDAWSAELPDVTEKPR